MAEIVVNDCSTPNQKMCLGSVERGMGSMKRLEFDALPREGGWDYIYLNDDVQGSEGGR